MCIPRSKRGGVKGTRKADLHTTPFLHPFIRKPIATPPGVIPYSPVSRQLLLLASLAKGYEGYEGYVATMAHLLHTISKFDFDLNFPHPMDEL